MNANINKSALSGKLRKVTFQKTSLHKISTIIEKEFNQSTCKDKLFQLVQIAKQHNLHIANQLEQNFNKLYHPIH
jgi:hypothetical protein